METFSAPSFDGSQPCVSSDPEAWFPTTHGMTSENNKAKEICGSCPFVVECAEYAIAQGSMLEGIWGGTTPKERASIRRRRALSDAA